MHKTFLKLGAIIAAIAVLLGAFGAHQLRDLVSARAVETFETSIKYMFYHAFALLITGILYKEFRNRLIIWAGRFFGFGILIFSGSLFYIAWTQAIVTPMMRWVGPVTPVGGLLFILGWVFLFVGFFRGSKK